MEEPSRFVTAPRVNPNPTYLKTVFLDKLMEMGFENDWSSLVMESLEDTFTLSDLEKSMQHANQGKGHLPRDVQRTMECVRWLAQSNYEIDFCPSVAAQR